MYGEPPRWNSNDPAGSFAALAQAWNEKARFDFLSAGRHPETVYLVSDDGLIAEFPLGGKHRASNETSMMKTLHETNPYGTIHVSQAQVFLKHKPKGSSTKSDQTPDDRSMTSPEVKTEALVVKMESRVGAARIWLHPILRGDGRAVKVSLADAIRLPDPPPGKGCIFS